MTDAEAIQKYMVERRRREMLDALERAKTRSHRLPDGRYVLDVEFWPGMKIETPKVWDYKERLEAVEMADAKAMGIEVAV